MDLEVRTTICQCSKCNSVFEWNNRRENACPECGGKYRIIRFANRNDERYLDKLSLRLNG